MSSSGPIESCSLKQGMMRENCIGILQRSGADTDEREHCCVSSPFLFGARHEPKDCEIWSILQLNKVGKLCFLCCRHRRSRGWAFETLA